MAQPLTDVVYVQRFELPSPMGHAIQIVSTARAMAEQGVRVHLFVHTLHRRHPADVVQQDMGWVSPDNLLWHRIPSRHKGVAGLIYRADLLRHLVTRGRVIFYARQRRQTLQLLALRHLRL